LRAAPAACRQPHPTDDVIPAKTGIEDAAERSTAHVQHNAKNRIHMRLRRPKRQNSTMYKIELQANTINGCRNFL